MGQIYKGDCLVLETGCGGGGGICPITPSTCEDGNLTISAGNVTCRPDHYFMCAKEWNFDNLTICPGITVMFCGNGDPVIKAATLCNLGTIDTYGPKTQDYLNFMNPYVYAIGTKDYPDFECLGGCGYTYAGCETRYAGNGGGIGEAGGEGRWDSTYSCGGACTQYAGGGGGGTISSGTLSQYYGCDAVGGVGGNGGGGACARSGGGGGFGLTQGGNGGNAGTVGQYGGDGGGSLYGDGGMGGCSGCTAGCGGRGGDSLYGTGGRGGCGYHNSNVKGGDGGRGRNGGQGANTACGPACCSGKGGDAYNWHFGLTIIADNFYNCCIDAHGGNGGSSPWCAGNGGDAGDVTILYCNMCCRGDINIIGGHGGASTNNLYGKDGSDGKLIIGQY